MTQPSPPSYTDISRALQKTALKLHPSQVHGLICGILCGNPNSESGWEQLVTGQKETQKTHEVLQALYATSAHQLQEFLLEFQLVLPADKQALPLRAEALTLWCQGFLTGLKLMSVKIEGREKSEVTEAIDDIIEIAKMNYEEVIASEEDEQAYIELVEYVRMAVILIYQDLRERENAIPKITTSNHLH